jgi:methyl-accepting chemotaxis protein-1 (serine sensor receptor)
MDEVTQSNAALVEEAAAAADTVQVRARSLVQSVAFFKVGENHHASEIAEAA